MSSLNEELKDCVAAIRKFGEPIEVFWQGEPDEPWDQDKHGNWQGDLVDMRTLRKWLRKREPDKREITIYCRGDDITIKFNSPL